MALKDSQWYQIMLELCQMVPKWFPMVHNSMDRCGMVPNGVEGCRMEPKGAKCCKILWNRMVELVPNRSESILFMKIGA